MPDTKGQSEPSMEEILASIRRIIAEDGEPAADATALPQAAPPGPTAANDEILELTEVVDDEGAVSSIGGETPYQEPPLRDPPPYVPSPVMEPARPLPAGDRLVSDETAAQSMAALSKLTQLGHTESPMPDHMPLGNGQRTIEEMVLNLLRPMLKNWLDNNLAGLVERLVKDEIARMVRDIQKR
jgi:cell pole-organizing protein PopZ